MTQVRLPVALLICPTPEALLSSLQTRCELVHWYDLSDAEQGAWLQEQASAVTIVMTSGNLGCPNQLVDQLPALKLIAINGVGFDKVDIPYMQKRGVAVTNTPGVLTNDVADLAVGLVLGLFRNLHHADAFARRGDWQKANFPLARQVSGRHFGIVGLGRIGMAIAQRLSAFGKVSYTSRQPKTCDYSYVDNLETLARNVDVLILCAAATPETRHIVDRNILAALGSEGVLVNIARGALVDESALVDALQSGAIAGAALDVFEQEPLIPEGLVNSDRVLLAPHIGSATVECRAAMADLVLANINAYLNEEPLLTPVD